MTPFFIIIIIHRRGGEEPLSRQRNARRAHNFFFLLDLLAPEDPGVAGRRTAALRAVFRAPFRVSDGGLTDLRSGGIGQVQEVFTARDLGHTGGR